jgi:hypothetical protein
MAEKHHVQERHNDQREQAHRSAADERQQNDRHQPYVDPAEEAMNTNPNISPPIHPRPD